MAMKLLYLLLLSCAVQAATLSLTTETTVRSNRTTTVYVFRAAGDMGSTNRVTSSRLTPADKLTALQCTFMTKEELAKQEELTREKPTVMKLDTVRAEVVEAEADEPIDPKPDPEVKPEEQDPEVKPTDEPILEERK